MTSKEKFMMTTEEFLRKMQKDGEMTENDRILYTVLHRVYQLGYTGAVEDRVAELTERQT